MINNVMIRFVFSGKKFAILNNENLESKFNFVYHPNSSRFLPSGKEQRLDYGYTELEKSMSIEEEIEYLLDKLQFIEENLKELLKYGLQEITLYLTYRYENQFNYEFSPIVLKKIVELSIKLCISTYE